MGLCAYCTALLCLSRFEIMSSRRCSRLAGWGMSFKLGMGWKIWRSIEVSCVDIAAADMISSWSCGYTAINRRVYGPRMCAAMYLSTCRLDWYGFLLISTMQDLKALSLARRFNTLMPSNVCGLLLR